MPSPTPEPGPEPPTRAELLQALVEQAQRIRGRLAKVTLADYERILSDVEGEPGPKLLTADMLPPWHHERPWSPLELDDIRRNWTEHPERFCYAAGRWLATLDLVDPGADR